ncbi:MAG: helix-turn-helix transcriptional regulator [bacterium]
MRKHRMDLGLFQKDVARFVGVVTDTVTLWEKGRKEPSKRYLKRIEQFLKKK